MTVELKKVAVCGSGAMGIGIAQVAAQAGASVVVFDVNVASLNTGRAQINENLSRLVQKGKLNKAQADSLASAILWTSDITALDDSNLVIEAIVEDLFAKKTLFAEIEASVSDKAIIATNTSSIPIARLARDLKHSERFVGMHFFNPATMMRLVEVVPGPATDPAVTSTIEELATAWGKVAVRVADVPGFIVNRVARPYYAEAFRAIQEAAAPPELVDELFRASAGFRMGPLELTDLIGQDINFAVARSVYDSYFGATRFIPQLQQASLVDAGWLGRKSGRGVYDYREGRSPTVVAVRVRPLSTDYKVGRPTLASPSSAAINIGDVVVRFNRGATARREASLANCSCALLDWFDLESASAVGFSASDENAAAVAASLISSWGLIGYQIADRPGGLLTRTLAQIANAAADAVLEQVSDEAGIDLALRFGANYPFGPFAWTNGIGRSSIIEVLTAIAEETGQNMYRPSEYWSREPSR